MTVTADVYTDALLALEFRAEELRAEIDAATEAERAAIRSHVKQHPTKRAFADIAGEPAKFRRKLEKATKELASVEVELPLLRQAAVDAERDQVKRDLLRFEREVRAVEGEAPEAWEKLREAYAGLIRLYVSEAGRITRERQRINEAAKAMCDNHGALRAEWERIYESQQVHPLPSTFAAAARALEIDATSDRELAGVLRNRPESWISTGLGAGFSERVS